LTKEWQHSGTTGEEIGCDYLKEQGDNIVERDYRYRIGEVDIVTANSEYLTFCKVKTHRNKTGLHTSLSESAIIIEKLRMLG